MPPADFYEEDEPLEKLKAAFDRGEKRVTIEPVHICDHDCPPVGVHGAVPTGEVFEPAAHEDAVFNPPLSVFIGARSVGRAALNEEPALKEPPFLVRSRIINAVTEYVWNIAHKDLAEKLTALEQAAEARQEYRRAAEEKLIEVIKQLEETKRKLVKAENAFAIADGLNECLNTDLAEARTENNRLFQTIVRLRAQFQEQQRTTATVIVTNRTTSERAKGGDTRDA